MIGTYASAALICAASLLVGRAILGFAGYDGPRRWLAPAIGFAALVAVAGFLARWPGHATTAALGLVAMLVAAGLLLWWRGERPASVPWLGVLLAVLVAAVLSIPFAVSGRWGLLGVGFNNDLGLHLAWAEWLRNGLGPAPEAGYPLGPHAIAATLAALPGIGLGQAFVGEIFAIGILTALAAVAALGDLGAGRRLLAALLVAISYLGASYFAQGAFKETAEALFVLAFALWLNDLDRRQADRSGRIRRIGPSARGWVGWLGFLLGPLALAGGIFFSYSFAGLAWPLAVLVFWGATVPEIRAALRPAALRRAVLRPAPLLAIVVIGGIVVAATLAGPYAFVHGFDRVAGTNTYGPVSPAEALGVWPASNYRLDAAGGAQLSGLAIMVGALAVLAGAVWWLRRRQLAVPIALAACTLLYLASLAGSGEYSQAKALMIAAPLAMLVAIRPLLAEFGRRRYAWTALAAVFVAGAAYSSLLVLRDAPIGPPGHGAELQAFLPYVEGEPVLYAGQDRYAAYELMGADTHVPLVEFPDAEVAANPEKPFDTGNAYSPIDFDSFSRATLDRFPYVIAGRAAWNSEAPPNFRRVASTPSYVLWRRTGATPRHRHVLLEGVEPAARVDCAAPELRILTANRGRASLFPGAVSGFQRAWSPSSTLEAGDSASQILRLPAGEWSLSLQYFSPFDLTLTAPGLDQLLAAALDGQRPNTISLANAGQFWPVGTVRSSGAPIRFAVTAADPNTLQRLSGYTGKASLGELVAVPDGAHRIVPLAKACGGWLDWYEAAEAP